MADVTFEEAAPLQAAFPAVGRGVTETVRVVLDTGHPGAEEAERHREIAHAGEQVERREGLLAGGQQAEGEGDQPLVLHRVDLEEAAVVPGEGVAPAGNLELLAQLGPGRNGGLRGPPGRLDQHLVGQVGQRRRHGGHRVGQARVQDQHRGAVGRALEQLQTAEPVGRTACRQAFGQAGEQLVEPLGGQQATGHRHHLVGAGPVEAGAAVGIQVQPQPVPVAERGGCVQGRLHPARGQGHPGADERFGDDRLLEAQLGRVGGVLQVAAAAGGVERAGRGDPVGRGRLHPHQPGLQVAAVGPGGGDGHGLARQHAGDHHRHAVRGPAEAQAAHDHLVDFDGLFHCAPWGLCARLSGK